MRATRVDTIIPFECLLRSVDTLNEELYIGGNVGRKLEETRRHRIVPAPLWRTGCRPFPSHPLLPGYSWSGGSENAARRRICCQNYFAHGPVKNSPPLLPPPPPLPPYYCSVARENLVIRSFHCFSSPPSPAPPRARKIGDDEETSAKQRGASLRAK